jgi:hypothetical protein
VVVFPFAFHIFKLLANLWLICLQGKFPILKTSTCPEFYPLIRPLRRPLSLNRGRILIPGFIQSPPKLAVWDVELSLQLGYVGKSFPFTEDETQRHFSYLSGSFTGQIVMTGVINFAFFLVFSVFNSLTETFNYISYTVARVLAVL